MLNKKLRPYLKSLFPNYDNDEIDDIVLFLVSCQLNLNSNFNLDSQTFLKIASNGLVERDIISGKTMCKISIFENDDKEEVDYFKIELTDEQIQSYRKLFSGIRTGSMGDKQIVTEKLYNWLNRNRNVAFYQVLAATQNAIENGERKFIPNADNFVFNERGISPLSIALDELELSFKNNFS